MQIDDFSHDWLEPVRVLNLASVPHVNALDARELLWFADKADYFRLATMQGRLAGFLIGLGPGLEYASPNYRFFCRRHRKFAYVDRVAVAADARRQGVAQRLYADYIDAVRGRAAVMTCEVNLRPANPGSLRFHEKLGFRIVATQETDGGNKEVALMEMAL